MGLSQIGIDAWFVSWQSVLSLLRSWTSPSLSLYYSTIYTWCVNKKTIPSKDSTPCHKKNVYNCSCQNFVKFPPTLIISGTKMAKKVELCELYLFSTSTNARQRTTVLNADVPHFWDTVYISGIVVNFIQICAVYRGRSGPHIQHISFINYTNVKLLLLLLCVQAVIHHYVQLQGFGHQNSRVPANLMDPGGGRSTSSTPPVDRWPDAILSFATGPKDLVCWDNIGESGNVAE